MRKVAFVGLILSSWVAFSQNESIDLEQFAERLFQVQDENIAYEDIYESLLLFYSDKLHLNKATPEELESLYLLSPGQIASFFDYRDQFGNLISIHELQSIPLFDLQTIRSMLPFVTVKERLVDNRPFLQRLIHEENNYFLLRYSRRLERQVGYSAPLPLINSLIKDEEGEVFDTVSTPPERYLGSPDKIYGRFRTSHKDDFSLGFTFEKDAGEAFSFDQNRVGFDFYSYHLLLENKLGFDKIMLGDFQLQSGQGIVFGAGFNAGKGAETVNSIKRSTIGIRPYTSVLESGFFRGMGLTKKMGDVELTSFYSNLNRDGNIEVDSLEFALIFNGNQVNTAVPAVNPNLVFEEEFANSIINTGLHRTNRELGRKYTINEQSYGGMVTYSPNRRLRLGVNALHTRFKIPIGKTPNNYNQFEFKGDRNTIASIFGNYTWQNFSFFGEAARSSSSGVGAVGGLVASLSSKIDFALMLRNYDKDFHSFYGNAFSEGSRNINEKGTYWGLAIKPSRKHKLNLYYDRFSFPWLRFRTEAPSVGNEWLVRYSHQPTKKINMYAQIRQQTRQLTLPSENLNILTDQVRFNYLFNVDYEITNRLKLKTRVQGSTQNQASEKTKGFAIIQDVNFTFWKVKFHTRMALFETDNFSNAQYVHENDVLYSFSIPAYAGSGIRNYIMARYDPFKNLSFWVRYARTTFPSPDAARATIGSSLEASQGDTSSEIKMMVRARF